MKVRLKLSFGLLADLNLLFQFHEGPIKTYFLQLLKLLVRVSIP